MTDLHRIVRPRSAQRSRMSGGGWRETLLPQMMIVYPDLGAHINAIDDRLAPHAQIGNQFIDGRDLIDFCAGGALVPNGFWPLMQIHYDVVLRSSTEPSSRLV